MKNGTTIDELLDELRENEPERYNAIIENVKKRTEEYKGRGGKREGAGRPKVHENRKTITKQLPEQTVIKIKDYSKDRHISENEALDELINAGYEQLKNRA